MYEGQRCYNKSWTATFSFKCDFPEPARSCTHGFVRIGWHAECDIVTHSAGDSRYQTLKVWFLSLPRWRETKPNPFFLKSKKLLNPKWWRHVFYPSWSSIHFDPEDPRKNLEEAHEKSWRIWRSMNEMHEYSRFQYIAHWLFRILRAMKHLQVIGGATLDYTNKHCLSSSAAVYNHPDKTGLQNLSHGSCGQIHCQVSSAFTHHYNHCWETASHWLVDAEDDCMAMIAFRLISPTSVINKIIIFRTNSLHVLLPILSKSFSLDSKNYKCTVLITYCDCNTRIRNIPIMIRWRLKNVSKSCSLPRRSWTSSTLNIQSSRMFTNIKFIVLIILIRDLSLTYLGKLVKEVFYTWVFL